MTRPRLLDLFCGAGGAGKGYADAGFEVVGVDINPQKNYPFEFHQDDALEYLAANWRGFDAIHASPPCQRYAGVTAWRGNQEDHPDLVPETRRLLTAISGTWVIENVPEAPVRRDLFLCGTQFGLNVRRHRAFEMSIAPSVLVPQCNHQPTNLPFMHKGERAYADALGCEWMTNREGRQAIPPAYTEFIGRQLLDAIEVAA